MNFNLIESKIVSGEKIYNIPLRVCYYARVSTDSDVQLNSLDNQSNYYEDYIKRNPLWTFVSGYIDEGVSGVRVEKRESFKKMIRDAKLKKFDLIITKEVSRFARDIEDSIHYIRELKNAGVGVYFENQNLNTFDGSSELILNLMFNLAQEESRKLSSRIKFGHKESIKKGHVLGSSNIIGYKKDNCKLVIVEKEAQFVRLLFELYATGKYGFYKLSKYLGNLGYLNKKGNYYDKDTLKRIISNPKYKGYYRGHTYETIDYRTKRRKKININEQTIFKCTDGSIPTIVSEELWDRANQILNSRTKAYLDNSYFTGGLKYSLSSKIYCMEHNINYQRSHGSKHKNRPTWSCGNYLKYKLDGCSSPIIAEKDLLEILKKIFNNLIDNKDEINNEMLELYKTAINENNYKEKLNNIDNSIKEIENKKNKTLELIYKDIIKEEDVRTYFDKYKEELNKLLISRNDCLKKQELLKDNLEFTNRLSHEVKEELDNNSLDDFIRKFVTEIIVSKIDNDRYNLSLDIYLNLLGKEKVKMKGACHINGTTNNQIEYLKNIKIESIEKKRINDNRNTFTCNVYIESL